MASKATTSIGPASKTLDKIFGKMPQGDTFRRAMEVVNSRGKSGASAGYNNIFVKAKAEQDASDVATRATEAATRSFAAAQAAASGGGSTSKASTPQSSPAPAPQAATSSGPTPSNPLTDWWPTNPDTANYFNQKANEHEELLRKPTSAGGFRPEMVGSTYTPNAPDNLTNFNGGIAAAADYSRQSSQWTSKYADFAEARARAQAAEMTGVGASAFGRYEGEPPKVMGEKQIKGLVKDYIGMIG